MKKTLLTLYFLFSVFAVDAQSVWKPTNKHRLDIALFRYARISESVNHVRAPQYLTGIYYERYLGPYNHLVAGFEIGKGVINDKCRSCSDQYGGKGMLKEMAVLAGMKYFFLHQGKARINPFVQMEAYYALSAYSGNFSGGFSGGPLNINNTYRKYGGIFRVCVEIGVSKRLYIMPMFSLKYGKIKVKEKVANRQFTIKDYATTPLELRVGIAF